MERQASKKFYNKCSDNSSSQIVFRTDIFRKLTLGAPVFFFFFWPFQQALKLPEKESIYHFLHTYLRVLGRGSLNENYDQNLENLDCFRVTSRPPCLFANTIKRRPCWCAKPILWQLNFFLRQKLSFVQIGIAADHVGENALYQKQ